MDVFTAKTQRNLSFLVIGGVFLLVLLNGTGLVTIGESILLKFFDAAFLVVLLFWFQRQRTDAPLPPPSAITAPAPLSPQPKDPPHG